jgi:TonB-linked SusC/RagA family outer membrane protein
MRKVLLTLVAVAFVLYSYAQERILTGKVTTTEDGSPLPGVNVVLAGTTAGTTTDANGQFSVSVPATGGKLVFSFIGLKTTEVEIGTRTSLDVSMDTDVTQLSEVIVTALGIEVDKDKFASAASTVAGNAVSKSGEATLINGLSGKASGVNITRSSGDPGAGSYIQIRGQSTITGNLQPLIVLDGVPIYNSTVGNIVDGAVSSTDGVVQQSRLNDINPNDIESVEVLKGASAAAQWGTRAANGVIMITTKKGSSEKGKINISLNSTYSVDKVYITHDLQKNWGSGTLMQYRQTPPSGYSWGDYIPGRKGGEDGSIKAPGAGYNGYFEAADGTKFYAVPAGTAALPHGGKNSTETYDYKDYLFKTGGYWDNSISLNGGDANDNFYLSVGNMNQTGIIKKNSDYDRTTFKLKVNKRFNSYVKLGTNFQYSAVKSNRVQMGSNTSGLYLGGLRTSPDFNSEYAVGTYVNAAGLKFPNRQRGYRNPLGAGVNSIYDNPLWMMDHNLSTTQVGRFIGSTELNVNATKWLNFTARVGVDSYSDRRKDFFDPLAAAIQGGRLTLSTIRETQANADIFGNADLKLSDDLTLNAIVGMNFNQRQFDLIGATINNFIITNQIPQDITNAAAANKSPFNSLEYQRMAAGYTSLDFGFKDQLFVNLTGRGESASTFGSEVSSTFFFPSASAAWQFSKLLNGGSTLSFGKLRAGWGNVGIQPSPYGTATYFVGGGFADGWGSALSSSGYGNGGYTESTRLGNAKLKPEMKTEIEIGTDLRFFQDRVSLGFTYFTNKTTGAILPVATASSTGYSDKVANAASLQNHGVEIDLGATVLKTGNFSWNVSANWTRLRNKVTDLAGTSSLFLAGFTGSSSRAVAGQPVGVLWGVDWQKDANGKMILDAKGFPQAAGSESVIGNPNPDWKGGLGNTFQYKGLQLYVLLEATWGGDIWAGTSGIMNHFGRSQATDVTTTLSAADAAATPVKSGLAGTTVATRYPANADGTYTFRGSVVDYGGGKVALDQAWYTSLGGGFGPVSSQFIRDASNWRVREVTLSYALNSDGFKKATRLTSVNFSLTGRNLFITGPDVKLIGNDPETNLTGPTNGRGLEYFNNPSTRSYLFSVKINY